MFLINLKSSHTYCLDSDSTNPLQIPDLIDIKVEESEEEEEEKFETPVDSPEQECPRSLPTPVGMMFPKMLDVSKVKLRSRDPPQKSSPDDSKEEQTSAKPAWMNDLKKDNRRSVGIFLERQELSNIRYLCAVVNVNVRKEFFCRQNIFKVSCHLDKRKLL